MAHSTFDVARLDVRRAEFGRSADVAVRTTEINVVFTTVSATTKAIRVAAALSRSTGASVRLIDPRSERYPMPSSENGAAAAPNWISAEELEREHIVALAGVPVHVLVVRCGRPVDAVRIALRQRSLVVIGGRRSWLPTRTERLQRALEDLGHVVVFVNDTRTEE